MAKGQEAAQLIEKYKQDPSLTIAVKNLGLRFYVNPNYAFTLKGMYRGLFEKSLYQESLEKQGISPYRWIWRNLDFSIKSGDIIAIMGANGEGKTTLLRTLAGLLSPDEGAIVAKHRPHLLSSGVGFREELSGYENIRIGSLFLGASAEEVEEHRRKIVEFSELSDADMSKPLKYYSDGMKARLVFSVATFTDKKILFFDEILGAGDIGFQKKARARMEQMMKTANTIVVVSHSREFILGAATKAMLLNKGQIVDIGETARIVAEYEKICSH